MTYPNAHLLLTWHWYVVSSPTEGGQIGLRFDSTAPASQALVDAAATPVIDFWSTNATGLIANDFALTFLRLASIGTNGRYVPGTIAYDHTIPGGARGGGSGGSPVYQFPLQVACVSSLLTAMPRGQAHKGRVYLPPLVGNLQTNYQWLPAATNNRSNALSACLSSLNTVMPGFLSVFSKGSKAAPTVGAKQLVTGLTTGTRPDVQRRRANQLTETQSIVGNVTHP